MDSWTELALASVGVWVMLLLSLHRGRPWIDRISSLLRMTFPFVGGVVVILAIGRGLRVGLDTMLPTESGSTADVAKVWLVLLVWCPLSGFILHLYSRAGKDLDENKDKK